MVVQGGPDIAFTTQGRIPLTRIVASGVEARRAAVSMSGKTRQVWHYHNEITVASRKPER